MAVYDIYNKNNKLIGCVDANNRLCALFLSYVRYSNVYRIELRFEVLKPRSNTQRKRQLMFREIRKQLINVCSLMG